jgi:serine/threonine-protein phosphatase 2B catalytic subunit
MRFIGNFSTNLLFLGDYVDRGVYSFEVCLFLFCLKLSFPKEVTMLRGNHESRAMTEHFTFRNEILQKFEDESIYELFIECFEAMPIAADVNGDYLCMHGGISKELKNASDINKDARTHSFTKNAQRECSVKFGLEPVKKVLKHNNYISVIRAH